MLRAFFLAGTSRGFTAAAQGLPLPRRGDANYAKAFAHLILFVYTELCGVAMTSHVLDRQTLSLNWDENQVEAIAWLMDHLPVSFRGAHCRAARYLLSWSINDLSSASGVSSQAIQRLERGARLNEVSMQALAFALEAEGLVFFPGHPPLRGMNCRGSTKDPRNRRDYHLLE